MSFTTALLAASPVCNSFHERVFPLAGLFTEAPFFTLSNDVNTLDGLSLLLLTFAISFLCHNTLFIFVILCEGYVGTSSIIMSNGKKHCYFSSSNIGNFECQYKNQVGILGVYQKEHIKSFNLNSYLYWTFISHIKKGTCSISYPFSPVHYRWKFYMFRKDFFSWLSSDFGNIVFYISCLFGENLIYVPHSK